MGADYPEVAAESDGREATKGLAALDEALDELFTEIESLTKRLESALVPEQEQTPGMAAEIRQAFPRSEITAALGRHNDRVHLAVAQLRSVHRRVDL